MTFTTPISPTATSYMKDLGFSENLIPGIINSILCAPIYLYDNCYCLNYLYDPKKHSVHDGDYARIIVTQEVVLQLTALELAAAGAIYAKKLVHCDMENWNTVIRLRRV